MSYLDNPNFSGFQVLGTLPPWFVANIPNAVTYNIVRDPTTAYSGEY